jgi:hypothetical protein
MNIFKKIKSIFYIPKRLDSIENKLEKFEENLRTIIRLVCDQQALMLRLANTNQETTGRILHLEDKLIKMEQLESLTSELDLILGPFDDDDDFIN